MVTKMRAPRKHGVGGRELTAEQSPNTASPLARICLDVDDTLIDWRIRLRPLAREVLAELKASGFEVHIWSGIGRRWDVIDLHGLRPLIDGCHRKPLDNHVARLAELEISFVPDYVVDDYAEVVRVFGGWWIPPPTPLLERDRRLLDMLYHIQETFGLPRGFTYTGLVLDDDTPSGEGQGLAKGSVRER
jgi:hypothetical protein